MNFASQNFFLFLPAVLLVYRLLQSRQRKYQFLLVASWFFYMSWNPRFIWVILFTSVIDYAAGLLIEGAPTAGRRRAWLLVSLASNLGFLAAFKYTNFLLANAVGAARMLGCAAPDLALSIALPLGISFHTFQGISYTMDVYRGRIPAVRGFVDFALFVAFFPQLVAGPIVRAVEFLPQMTTPPRVTAGQVVDGFHFFVVGLFKKILVADRLAEFVDAVFARPQTFDASTLRWAALAYAGQIYCDFSGYSDMAVGCAKWFGFELPKNFDSPYLSANITDFWRRWHISLSSWLRDYLFIPLGGSRGGRLRTLVNLLVTFTLCGLWHGASWNYVFWGFFNGVLICLHRVYSGLLAGRPWSDRVRSGLAFRAVATATTFFLVAAGFVLLRTESRAGCWMMERALFGFGHSAGTTHWLPGWVAVLLALVAASHFFRDGTYRPRGVTAWPPLLRAGAYLAAVVLVVTFGAGQAKTFIYFQF